jgi:hypothetical protein
MTGDGVEPCRRVDRFGRIRQQPLLEFRIDPGTGDDARPDMRANLGLDILDDLVERCGVDIALLGQDRLERLHPELHFGQLAAPAAEPAEPRAETKGNAGQQSTRPT